MNFEMDTREVALLAMKLKAAGATLRPQLNKALKREVEQAAMEARAAAPKDRPWLGTEQGLQVVQKFPLSWSIISPRDPRGQSVGYRVVYGTSKMPPNDFISGPLGRAGDRFNRKAVALMVTI